MQATTQIFSKQMQKSWLLGLKVGLGPALILQRLDPFSHLSSTTHNLGVHCSNSRIQLRSSCNYGGKSRRSHNCSKSGCRTSQWDYSQRIAWHPNTNQKQHCEQGFHEQYCWFIQLNRSQGATWCDRCGKASRCWSHSSRQIEPVAMG